MIGKFGAVLLEWGNGCVDYVVCFGREFIPVVSREGDFAAHHFASALGAGIVTEGSCATHELCSPNGLREECATVMDPFVLLHPDHQIGMTRHRGEGNRPIAYVWDRYHTPCDISGTRV